MCVLYYSLQAFTEHYPVVHFAKWVLGMPVVTDMSIEAEHAYLPKYELEQSAMLVNAQRARMPLPCGMPYFSLG